MRRSPHAALHILKVKAALPCCDRHPASRFRSGLEQLGFETLQEKPYRTHPDQDTGKIVFGRRIYANNILVTRLKLPGVPQGEQENQITDFCRAYRQRFRTIYWPKLADFKQ